MPGNRKRMMSGACSATSTSWASSALWSHGVFYEIIGGVLPRREENNPEIQRISNV